MWPRVCDKKHRILLLFSCLTKVYNLQVINMYGIWIWWIYLYPSHGSWIDSSLRLQDGLLNTLLDPIVESKVKLSIVLEVKQFFQFPKIVQRWPLLCLVHVDVFAILFIFNSSVSLIQIEAKCAKIFGAREHICTGDAYVPHTAPPPPPPWLYEWKVLKNHSWIQSWFHAIRLQLCRSTFASSFTEASECERSRVPGRPSKIGKVILCKKTCHVSVQSRLSLFNI